MPFLLWRKLLTFSLLTIFKVIQAWFVTPRSLIEVKYVKIEVVQFQIDLLLNCKVRRRPLFHSTGRVLVQQRASFAAPPVRHWYLASANERLRGALWQHRSPVVHHRKVGQCGAAAEGAYLVCTMVFVSDFILYLT